MTRALVWTVTFQHNYEVGCLGVYASSKAAVAAAIDDIYAVYGDTGIGLPPQDTITYSAETLEYLRENFGWPDNLFDYIVEAHQL